MTLPQAFAEYTSRLFGEERWQRYLSSFDEATPVSIRLNSGTGIEDLGHLPIAGQIPWSERGYYLSERPQFTLDPLLHAGAYYVQEASSQYLDTVLREATAGMDISLAADFCAAPGGKTLILKDHLPGVATLIANEFVRKRAWILTENVEKATRQTDGKDQPRIIVTNNSTADIAASGMLFDLIVCDVPCSGEGMFRKDHDTIAEWSQENVARCARLQREIVGDAWRCLRQGGVLVYSTCTFNEYEDEDNLLYIIKELGGVPVCQPRKFIPGIDKGEGQFMAAVRKPAPDNTVAKPSKASKKKAKRQGGLPLNIIGTFPKTAEGEERPRCDVPLDTALNYLRGQAIVLPPDTPRGVIDICYCNHLLGEAKNIGSRANNLYPKEWRIKHQ